MDGAQELHHYSTVLCRHSPRAACADDLALQVFEHVSQKDKLHLSLVCKSWRKLLAESPMLWQTFSGKQAPVCFGCSLAASCVYTMVFLVDKCSSRSITYLRSCYAQ